MDKEVLRDKMFAVNTSFDNLWVIVKGILGNKTEQLDECFRFISQKLSSDKELTDSELDKMLLRLPLYVDNLSTYIQELEVRCGVASAMQTEAEADATINSVGTVAEKKAQSDLAGIENGLIVSAYKSALTLLRNKVGAAYELLASAKKVQARRLEEFRSVSMLKGVE